MLTTNMIGTRTHRLKKLKVEFAAGQIEEMTVWCNTRYKLKDGDQVKLSAIKLVTSNEEFHLCHNHKMVAGKDTVDFIRNH